MMELVDALPDRALQRYFPGPEQVDTSVADGFETWLQAVARTAAGADETAFDVTIAENQVGVPLVYGEYYPVTGDWRDVRSLAQQLAAVPFVQRVGQRRWGMHPTGVDACTAFVEQASAGVDAAADAATAGAGTADVAEVAVDGEAFWEWVTENAERLVFHSPYARYGELYVCVGLPFAANEWLKGFDPDETDRQWEPRRDAWVVEGQAVPSVLAAAMECEEWDWEPVVSPAVVQYLYRRLT